jgi:oligopeptide transport system substrate-binding protein
MKRILFTLLIAALLCGLAVTGCGAPQAPSAVGGGGVLKLYGIDPITLDPAVSGDMTSHEYIAQIFSGLVRLDDNLEPAPDIAQSWHVSEDGRTYTFALRQDVRGL